MCVVCACIVSFGQNVYKISCLTARVLHHKTQTLTTGNIL